MKNVYGYIRVSTAKQGQGVSLTVQKEAIERFASQHNMNIIEWFEEKETAAKQGRPLFTNMMKLLNTKKAAGVIMHKIDRSARNYRDWVDISDLIDAGCEVHFAHESLDMTTRGGRLAADIQVAVAVDYIRNLRQEAIKGLYGRLKQGIYPFKAPAGYIDTGKGNYKTIDPVQGPLVQQAFELYATKKYTLQTLTTHLQQLGLMTTKHKRVSVNGLSAILNNPFYMGIMKIKGKHFNGGHEPLITPSLFNRVQAILRGNTNQKTTKHVFKYRKMLTCKGCGYSLIPETQKGHVYYRCHTKGCVTKGMREVTLDNLLLKAFAVSQLYPGECITLDELLRETENNWMATQVELIASVKLQNAHVKQRLERLTDCYIEGGLDKETYEERKATLLTETKSHEANEKMLLYGKEQIFRTARKFLELAKSLTKSFETGILEEQRELVELVTSKLMVEGKKLIITMRSPFAELSDRWNLQLGGLTQGTSRKEHTELVYSNINTSSIVGTPLSKEKLQSLLEWIFDVVSQLPDNSDETNHVI